MKSFDTIAIIATTCTSIKLSLTGIGLIVIPVSTDISCGLTISNEVIYEMIMQKFNNYKKQYEKNQQTVESFDQICYKSLQGNLIDKNKYVSLYNFFTRYMEG